MIDDSYIATRKDGSVTAYVGGDATRLARAKLLRVSINTHKRCGMIPTRGVTIAKMFSMATEYSGRKYKRGQHDEAIADLDKWISEMIAALPIVEARP